MIQPQTQQWEETGHQSLIIISIIPTFFITQGNEFLIVGADVLSFHNMSDSIRRCCVFYVVYLSRKTHKRSLPAAHFHQRAPEGQHLFSQRYGGGLETGKRIRYPSSTTSAPPPSWHPSLFSLSGGE